MNTITLIFVALSLAADAFAVSIASGANDRKMNTALVLRIAVFFGAFQAAMPIIGYFAGISVNKFIAQYDHWIAFCLLAAVGIKMIYEAFKLDASKKFNPASIPVLFILAIATSIDAFAVGITLSFLKISIVFAAVTIGIITFAVALAGVNIGKKLGHFFEKKIEIAAGILLIAIGTKILIQHIIS